MGATFGFLYHRSHRHSYNVPSFHHSRSDGHINGKPRTVSDNREEPESYEPALIFINSDAHHEDGFDISRSEDGEEDPSMRISKAVTTRTQSRQRQLARHKVITGTTSR